MNEFDKQKNALRIQYRDERISIQKDANRTIGRINTAIGMVNTPEARDILRAEKHRLYEATRQKMRDNQLCYRQQLEEIEEQYRAHLAQNPSNTHIRRMISRLCQSAEAAGNKSVTICFGDNRHATISFD